MRSPEIATSRLAAASAAAVLFAGTAHAQGYQLTAPADDRAPLVTDYGIGVTIGGGVEGFTSDIADDTTDIGGSWDLRVEFGTRFPLSVEAAYVGTAQNIKGLTGADSGTLIGTTAEAALKFNVDTGSVFRPFAFAGLGWRRYDVTDAEFTTAAVGIRDQDNLMVFPLGGGVRYDYRGIGADLRFTFRPAIEEDLILDTSRDSGAAAMHTWNVGAHVGGNF